MLLDKIQNAVALSALRLMVGLHKGNLACDAVISKSIPSLNIKLGFYIPRNTKYVILETFFPTRLFA